jgi:hypothetical protein
MRAWKLVNKPFEPEYPGDRRWNRNGAKFRFTPSGELDTVSHPTWDKILNHAGLNLDDAVATDDWCRKVGILSGADYLRTWIASMFQRPDVPLPYLFFYSQKQNTGKTTFHESLSLLMTHGYVKAEQALINPQGFNFELDGAVLCSVEEIDLSSNKGAYNRIKDWVTTRMLSIHPKSKNVYQVRNTTHWVQCANSHTYCPIFADDSRITMVCVPQLDYIIPRGELTALLEKEAQDFLATILNLDLPRTNDRLGIPVLNTSEKLGIQSVNKPTISAFLETATRPCDGAMIPFSALFEKFIDWIDPVDIQRWSRNRFARELPVDIVKGRSRAKAGQVVVANIAFVDDPITPTLRWKLSHDGFLDPAYDQIAQ